MEILTALKDNWNRLTLFATALGTLFTTFVVLPPAGGGEDMWYRYGTFLVALLTGLWFVPIARWGSSKFTLRWWAVAGFCTILSCVAFFWYNNRLERWTVPYWRDRRAVVGEQLTPDALAYQKTSGETDPLRLLKSYAGNAEEVWRAEEIRSRQTTLSLAYVLTVLFLASAVVSVSQAVYCASGSPASPGAQTSPAPKSAADSGG